MLCIHLTLPSDVSHSNKDYYKYCKKTTDKHRKGMSVVFFFHNSLLRYNKKNNICYLKISDCNRNLKNTGVTLEKAGKLW